MPRSHVALLGAAVIAAAAGCSSASSTTTPATTTTVGPLSASSAPPHGTGPVAVLYAGSLVTVMDTTLGPAFQSATGYTFSGTSGDSGSLANQVKAKTLQGDVFVSASAAKDQVLEGAANGSWVSWYATFATSKLVLGYNPHSRFASQLQSKPWYDVITEPGFLLGRTDPATDPKGLLTVTALGDAASSQKAATTPLETRQSNVFPENTLVGRLQAGQLDAGFFYAVEADAAGIPTVPLSGIPTLQAKYTVTVLNHAPHEAAAEAFVRFLVGSQAQRYLARDGVELSRPVPVTGTAPASLQAALSGS